MVRVSIAWLLRESGDMVSMTTYRFDILSGAAEEGAWWWHVR